MKWDTFKNLYIKLNANKDIKPNTKIRILYTKNNKRKTVECLFSELLSALWELFDQDNITVIAIFIIKGNKSQPIFRYVKSNHLQLNRPAEIGDNNILLFKFKPQRIKSILTKMLILKIYEELIYEF